MLKLQFADRRQPAMWLVDPRVTLGRDKSNTIVIDNEGVSVFHAEIRNEGGKIWLVDCGSVNGTYLNDHRVAEKIELKAGDRLRLHTVALDIVDPQHQTVPHIPAGTTLAPKLESPQIAQWQIKALTGTLSGRMFPITSTQVVGREPGCDIVVTGAHVSRRHAEFSIRAGCLWVKDLGSSNGTFINGKRVEETALANADEVKCDAMTFRVVAPESSGEAHEDVEATMFRPAIAVATGKPVAAVSKAADLSVKPVEKPAVQPIPAPSAPSTVSKSTSSATTPPADNSLVRMLLILLATAMLAAGVAMMLLR